MEIFKDIKGYEGLYKISNLGRVKSLKWNKEKILKGAFDYQGYMLVSLSKEGVQKTHKVHPMVAESFLGHKRDGTHKVVVDHIDGDNKNNKLSNLQLISNRENCSKDKSGFTSEYTGVSWHTTGKKWVAQIDINGKRTYLGLFTKEEDASEAYQRKLSLIIKTNKDE